MPSRNKFLDSPKSKLVNSMLALTPPPAFAKQYLRRLARYEAARDRTLTKAQSRVGFRPEVVSKLLAKRPIGKGSFRYPSNPTRAGFSTGYHEAFVVTDMTDKLASRSKGAGGLSKMPVMSSGFWSKYSGHSFPERNLEALVHAGDGARTDTARTVLSGPGGSVAGHTGSGVKTTGQSDAHNLLRDQSMRTLSDPHMTPRASAVISAATTVFTMAPGELASRAENAHKLKDAGARQTWEADRNDAKGRLALVHATLSAPEKAVVRRHMKQLVIDVGGKRELDPVESSSPRRSEHQPHGAAIAGGGYDRSTPVSSGARIGLPTTMDPRTANHYVSAPFRADRS